MSLTMTKKTVMTVQTSRWLHKFTILIFAVFLILIHLRLYQYAFDDAFIHFRIARNLFETGKPYFNVNEAVKVSTSSGWVIFLTILFSISHIFKSENSLPIFVSIINALATLGGSVVYIKIIGKVSKTQHSIITTILFYIIYTALVTPSSIGLMETAIALFVVGLGIYCLSLSKPEGFILLAFAVYLRLEFAIVLVLAAVLSMKNMRLRSIIGFSVLGFAPILLYDLYSFHTFIPQSIIAKSVIYLTTQDQTAGNILFFWLPTIFGSKNGVFLISAGVLFIIILLLTGHNAFKSWKRGRNFWPLFFWAWAILIIAGYISGHAFMFDWYYPLFTVPILVSFFLYANDAEYPQSIVAKVILFFLSFTSIISVSQTIFASINNPQTFSLFGNGSRVKTYLIIGEVLYEEYPNATLLSPEIGGLGYSFRGEILDPIGLASPEALNFHPMSEPGAIPAEYVKIKMPEIIVSYDIFAQALLQNEVIEQYGTIQVPAYLPEDAFYSEETMMFGSEFVRVYIRKDLSISKRLLDLEKNR